MGYTFPPAPQPVLETIDSEDLFPVRRVFCVGRNYAAHAREMGKDPDREPPFFFTKPGDAVTQATLIPYPPQTEDLHFEAELVVAIGVEGADIEETNAETHIWGYAVGCDLTRRDLQAEAKKMGRPWDMAKGFDASAVLGPLYPKQAPLTQGAIQLKLNDELRQSGDLSEMIWSVPEVIAYLSRYVTLMPGDLIMTGTPAGVGALGPDDSCTITVDGFAPLTFIMVA